MHLEAFFFLSQRYTADLLDKWVEKSKGDVLFKQYQLLIAFQFSIFPHPPRKHSANIFIGLKPRCAPLIHATTFVGEGSRHYYSWILQSTNIILETLSFVLHMTLNHLHKLYLQSKLEISGVFCCFSHLGLTRHTVFYVHIRVTKSVLVSWVLCFHQYYHKAFLMMSDL